MKVLKLIQELFVEEKLEELTPIYDAKMREKVIMTLSH